MLTKIKNVEKRRGQQYALYRCICGKEKIIRVSAVKSSSTKSCGCHRRKNASKMGKKAKTHGQTGSYLYSLWIGRIKNNCVWSNFEQFYDWAKDKWESGLILYSKTTYYDENSIFLPSNKSKSIHRKETCLKKYGYSSALEVPDIKDKIKQTNIKKYGVENPAQTLKVKQRTKENNRKKYGVDYPQQLEERRYKQKQFCVKKIGFDTENLAKEIGISRSAFLSRVRKYGLDQAVALGNYCTLIETIIKNFLDDKQIKYVYNKKFDKYYPDFVLPDFNLIIETDGLYWHSDAVNLNNRYHRNKLDKYEELGYRALFFREDEICNKQDIVFSIINNALKLNNEKFFARKCNIIELNSKDRKRFFEQNHLMGKGRGLSYGLVFGDQLVSVIQFTNRDGVIDISRFCNKLNVSVVGGFSKLITHIIRNNDVHKIQTFIDRRYGVGQYLLDLGFKLITDRLSFVWVKNGATFHRLRYRGNSGYEYGMYKLWDCGQKKLVKEINN